MKVWIISLLILLTITNVNLHGNHSGSKKKVKKNHEHNHNNVHSHDDHHHDHHHHAGHDHHSNGRLGDYRHLLTDYLTQQLQPYSKQKQGYIGAFIISTAPVPIFFIILIFNIKNIKILDTMSAFASGALLADVVMHNLPEIMEAEDRVSDCCWWGFLFKKEILICWGVILLFALEKFMALISRGENKIDDHASSHSHHHHHDYNEGILVALLGDVLHNITDGIAIGAAFNTNLKLGITLTISIFFHEIPHEVGDFCFLLKKKMTITSAFASQIMSATGAFIGVYISKLLIKVRFPYWGRLCY